MFQTMSEPVTLQNKNINIAVLYADADEKYWKELERHIILLTKAYKNVHIWTVKDIDLGEVVNQEIREQLRMADITLLLLSADFAFEDVFDEETRILLDNYARQRENNRYIMPIIVKDFIWRDHYDENYDIEKLKFFDKILQYPDNRERTYKEISELLNKYIQEINARSIQFVIPTWVGYLGGIMYNDGFIKNKTTDLYKKFQRGIRFNLIDDADEVINTFLAGEADLIWSTIDRLPQIIHKIKDSRPKVIFQASWSNGADAIIARNNINSIKELQGKKVIYPFGTPAHTFLKYVLNENGMDTFAIAHQAQKHTNLDLISKMFINDETIDAVVMWSPYVEACLNEATDAKIIAHTGEFPNLIADVVIASEDFINLNREELNEFFTGWAKQIQQFTDDELYEAGALGVLIDAIIKPLPSIIPSKIKQSLIEALTNYFDSSLKKVHLCSYKDNLRFFSIDKENSNIAEELYQRFLQLQYAEWMLDPAMQWSSIVDTSILESIQLD